MAFDGTEGNVITLSEGAALTKKYRLKNSNSIKGRFFGKKILQQIIDQDGCMGIRFYFGQDEEGNLQLVICGADKYENDMLDLIADFSKSCPSNCSSRNMLNS